IQKTDSQHPYLQNSLTTLSQGGALKVIVYGDSISSGYETTAFQWRYEERFHQYLANRYPSANITYVNKSVSGWTSANALSGLNSLVLTQNPDLVLIAFGMNDNMLLPPYSVGVPLATYKAYIKSMCEQINAIGAEVIVLGSMPPNPNWTSQQGIMDQYAAAAGEAASETGNAFVSVYNMWMRALERKGYNLGVESLLGNNLNHPNDFSHWMYFQALEEIW
ncbi:MAG: SGNH/GDSL hydrolase family protein, partial [Planctomycetes bacterium]|nr:SGNH/GDSL hydrolase family protein [Planctomycetota bacterium]